jgi:hypothetical protein
MKLNLPILDKLDGCERILIAGAGGGFDIFAGLPLYFTLREHGKTVHLANLSFTDLKIASIISQVEVLIPTLLAGAHGGVLRPFGYYPEGYLSQWFHEVRGEDVPVWMFAKTGVAPLVMAYRDLVAHVGGVDVVILVDGGVDSIMRGDESGAGTLLEDTVSLAAVAELDVPVKILTCIGFGSEVEEAVCHYTALENIAALSQDGAFWGSCSLTPEMDVFRQYEAACRYVWEQPSHARSHINTRIIPAVNGQFGDYHMYAEERRTKILVSPLMGLYWFFDMHAVIGHNLLIDHLRDTHSFDDALKITLQLRQDMQLKPYRPIPY